MKELARIYHADTDAYDRAMCSGPVRGGIPLPATRREAALSERHAREVYVAIMREAEASGIRPEDMRRAISDAATGAPATSRGTL